MSKPKILVGYHKPYDLLESEIFTPIHGGRAVALVPSKDKTLSDNDLRWMQDRMIGDDTGENISLRNRNYNELSIIYWAWKNYEKLGNPSHFGFMQYRRHLIFNEKLFDEYEPRNDDERAYAKINAGYVDDAYKQRFGLKDAKVKAMTDKYDVIVPKSCELSYYVESTEADFTERIEGTKKKDLRILKNAIAKLHPEYSELLEERLKASDKRCYQTFVMKKDAFFTYCEFLFSTLTEVDKNLDTSNYSINGQRTLGYLGEILFDLYFYKLINDGNTPCKELGTTYVCANAPKEPMKNKTAIVLLAYSDFESLELSLAVYGKFLEGTDTKLFVLQNGRGTYDTERTYRVAKRYADLFPHNIEVVDDIAPQKPYTAIKELLASKRMQPYEYICKVDDDAFPLTKDWFDRLCETFESEYAELGDNLGYVTALVNNNPFGFKQLIDREEILRKKYESTYARDHFIGTRGKKKGYAKQTLIKANEIMDGVNGTIWGYPYISRWLHQETTLKPDQYIEMTKDYPKVYVGDKRYSINCMLFAKKYWFDIENKELEFPDDDEYLSEQYCKLQGKSVAVNLAIPFVHLYFFIQREENRDMINDFRAVYEKWLNHPFPIAVQTDKAFENEARLRFIEDTVRSAARGPQKLHWKTRVKNNRFARKAWSVTPAPVKRGVKKVNQYV